MDNLIPLTEHNYKNSETPILSVFSWAFNHKDFIRESIESILVQRTNFKVEIIIHDDASSDGTKEIIKEYQDKYPFLFYNILQEENQWSQGKSVMNPLFEKPKGKYIALTHGDDYWTDPLKLQKQVDFLESNPKIVLCAHSIFMDIKGVICFDVFRKKYENTYVFNKEEFKYGNPISTVSTIFRNDIPNFSAENILKKDNICGDLPLWLELANHGDLAILPERMAVYRDGVGVMTQMKQNELSNFIDDLYKKHNIKVEKKSKNNKYSTKFKWLYFYIIKVFCVDLIYNENKKLKL